MLLGPVWEDYHKFIRSFGADISIKDYVRLYVRRSKGENIKIPKAMDAAFLNPETDDERQIFEMIQEYDSLQTTRHELDLFKLKTRLANAERKLQERTRPVSRSNRETFLLSQT